MNETTLSAPADRSMASHSLAVALGTTEAGLTSGLLEVLDRMEALVSIKEVASGAYVYANSRMAALFDREPAGLLSVRDAELMEPAQATAIRAAEQTALAHAACTVGEQRIERNGQRREFSVNRVSIPRADGAPTDAIQV